jgi:hypothetical protein
MSSLLDVRRGSQTPRVANFPPHDFTAAPEVIENAKKAKLFLDPWQEYILTHGLGQHLVLDEEGNPAAGDWTAKKNSIWVPRQNGKGGVIEALELAWLFLDDMKVDEITHSAHEHKTSLKAYKRMEKLIRRVPAWHEQVYRFRQSNGERMIILRDGRQLEYHTRSDTAVRGFSSPRLILDEAQELTAEQMAAILPTVSAMPKWQVWFLGTPPRVDDAWAYGLKSDGENAEPRLAHFDWGADLDLTKPDDRARVNDLELAYASNPALGIRIEIETVIDEQKPSGLGSKYPHERLCVWLPHKESAGVIDMRAWADIQDAASRREGDLAVAVDISVMRDWAAITIFGKRSDQLGHGQLIDYREGVEWIVPRLVEIRKELDPIAVGMGPGTFESLKLELTDAKFFRPDDLPEDELKRRRKDEKPRRGDLLIAGGTELAAACGQIRDAVKQRAFRVVPAVQLTEAAAGAKIRTASADATSWARATSEAEISPIGSLTVAKYTYEQRSWMFAHQRKRAPVGAPSQSALNTANLFRPQGRLKI